MLPVPRWSDARPAGCRSGGGKYSRPRDKKRAAKGLTLRNDDYSLCPSRSYYHSMGMARRLSLYLANLRFLYFVLINLCNCWPMSITWDSQFIKLPGELWARSTFFMIYCIYNIKKRMNIFNSSCSSNNS